MMCPSRQHRQSRAELSCLTRMASGSMGGFPTMDSIFAVSGSSAFGRMIR